MLSRDQIVALDKKLIWHPYTQMKRYIEDVDPVVVERAEGIYLYDKNGDKLIDGNASWWTNIVGHNHPRLMDALRSQIDKFAHCSMAGMTHEPAALLAEKLLPILGQSYSRLFFSDDGSTAVEVAIRMAFQYWRNTGKTSKNRFVTLSGAFHGETVGAVSVSGSDVFHQSIGELLFDCIHLPSPAHETTNDEAGAPWFEKAFATATTLIEQNADQLAAVIVEPLVQGAAGMLMYPPEYLAKLAKLCRDNDVLLIADEVFVGYGRTGTFLAHTQAGFEADIVCLAKGFSGGVLPMAGTATTDRIFQTFCGGPDETLWYGHSFTGNPLGAAVALETLRIFEDEQIVENLDAKCQAMAQGLGRLESFPWVRHTRRTGMISAFNLAEPGEKQSQSDYLATAGWRFYDQARTRGALLRPLGNVIYFVLPLTIEISQIEELFAIVETSLKATFE